MELLSARIPAALEEVDRLGPRLRAAAGDRLPEDRLFALELAVVEALTNIIRHGAPAGEIEVVLRALPDGVEASIRDDGPPPPPDLFAAPQLSDDPLAESGRGIGLILACADAVSLAREDGGNRLVLRFGAR